MRTAKLTIDGRTYLLCFSARVMRACVDRYGSMSGVNEALSDTDPGKALDESIWLLSSMMAAGTRYARLNGLECPEALTYDQMYDACGIDDLEGLKGKIAETIRESNRTNVEVEPPKNGAATPGS